jgi:hypothetical protein
MHVLPRERAHLRHQPGGLQSPVTATGELFGRKRLALIFDVLEAGFPCSLPPARWRERTEGGT